MVIKLTRAEQNRVRRTGHILLTSRNAVKVFTSPKVSEIGQAFKQYSEDTFQSHQFRDGRSITFVRTGDTIAFYDPGNKVHPALEVTFKEGIPSRYSFFHGQTKDGKELPDHMTYIMNNLSY